MSEEDQMMRAIAMSLGQEVSMEQRSDSPEVRVVLYLLCDLFTNPKTLS